MADSDLDPTGTDAAKESSLGERPAATDEQRSDPPSNSEIQKQFRESFLEAQKQALERPPGDRNSTLSVGDRHISPSALLKGDFQSATAPSGQESSRAGGQFAAAAHLDPDHRALPQEGHAASTPAGHPTGDRSEHTGSAHGGDSKAAAASITPNEALRAEIRQLAMEAAKVEGPNPSRSNDRSL